MATTLRVRKNATFLTTQEKTAFVNALLELKKHGVYDQFVHWHHEVMAPAIHRWEPPSTDYRNGAHRGPSFLPWHREFLLQLETRLQQVDPMVTIPYWDWTVDQSSATSPLWRPDFLGGNGLGSDQWRVQDGPFAEKNGRWPVPEYPEGGTDVPGTGLKRQFASGPNWDSLPLGQDVVLALNERFYDLPPYNPTPFNSGFRNRLEGFITQRGDPRVVRPGPQLHNRVHQWVGGNMTLMTSPDDPVFFLHHSFIDKLWATWQATQANDYPDEAPHYAPMEGGPPGHNLTDVLHPWTHSIRDVFDLHALGYTYEGLDSSIKVMLSSPRKRRGPFLPLDD